MYDIIKKNLDKKKIIALFGIVVALLILIQIAYKNTGNQTKKTQVFKSNDGKSDIINFKNFLLNEIRSPYININYKIAKGDTIQKILTKYKVKNTEIQKVINEYKKFGKSSQLKVEKIIDIIIKKETDENNSIIKRRNIENTNQTNSKQILIILDRYYDKYTNQIISRLRIFSQKVD